MKMLFVFNPNSGKAQIKNQLMKIIQVFSKAGYEDYCISDQGIA